jgi:hypothetical protein
MKRWMIRTKEKLAPAAKVSGCLIDIPKRPTQQRPPQSSDRQLLAYRRMITHTGCNIGHAYPLNVCLALARVLQL